MTETSPSTADQTSCDERWLTRGVAGIGTASFLADVGHEVPTALLAYLVPARAYGFERMMDNLGRSSVRRSPCA